MNITILCKVVDNYGDIGFVYRLVRSLLELDRTLSLRLVVSDLQAFKSMNNAIDASAPEQTVAFSEQACAVQQQALAASAASGSYQVFDWNDAAVCSAAFSAEPPALILECFQCGRPDWLDALLFGDSAKNVRPFADEAHIVRILNIEYLTAEDYADDFHCLKSGTRSLYVKKVNFMPGFTAKTAGLTLDRAFMRSLQTRALPQNVQAPEASFYVSIFSYERDFAPIVQALQAFQNERRSAEPGFTVHALVAAGKSAQPFFDAWTSAGKPFTATALPFLSQEEWDAVLCACDFNFVRGEDSLSRACLIGVPFLWHAYPQEDEYQLVKVQALFSRLEPFLPPQLSSLLETCWQRYNTNGAFDSELLLPLLLHTDELTASFGAFSRMLLANGNFSEHLLSYLHSMC